ncbi:MAG TPA: histidine kinase [Terriglobales bacterium]|nr:histidine kinase [Terriglobales bacterium]
MQNSAFTTKKDIATEDPVSYSWLIWALSFGVWTFVALSATATMYQLYRLSGMPMKLGSTLALEFSQVLTYAPLTPFVFGFATRYPIERRNWIRRSLLYLGAGILFALAHVILRGAIYGVWDSQTHQRISIIWDAQVHHVHIRWHEFNELFIVNLVDDITGTFLPIVMIGHAISYYRRFRERELRSSQLESQLANAHLHALKSKLQPHFLFNTLHSISALMHNDVKAADMMMSRLGDLLRMSLENDSAQETTLRRELEFVNAYLQIEVIRFGDRLVTSLEVPDDMLDAEVPQLLLQPLVENAIKHGISKSSAKGKIQISTRQSNSHLELCISNSGPPLPDTSPLGWRKGFGLRATKERLETLYGADHVLEMKEKLEGGADVFVRIPFRVYTRPISYELSLETPTFTER